MGTTQTSPTWAQEFRAVRADSAPAGFEEGQRISKTRAGEVNVCGKMAVPQMDFGILRPAKPQYRGSENLYNVPEKSKTYGFSSL